jgi:tetratricopeptide (TPR) repeat protein
MSAREIMPTPATGVPETMAAPESTIQEYVRRGDALYHKHLDITEPQNLLDQALNEYAMALELCGEAPAILGRVARIWLRKGQYSKATAYAQRALQKQPALADAHYVLGYVHNKENRFEESVRALGRAIRFGGWSTSRFRFAQFYSHLGAAGQTGNPLKKLWHVGAGAYQFTVASLLSPLDPEPVQLLRLCQILPGVLRAYMQEKGGNRDGALAEYQKLHERFVGLPPVMNLIGSVYQRRGMLEDALEWLQKAIQRDPLNEEGYFQLATLHEERGEYAQALSSYQRLLALRPGDAQVHCSLGNLYAMMNEYDMAASHYQSALALGDDDEWRALIAQTLGSLYQEIKKNPQAAQMAYQLAIELNPDEVNHAIHLGILYFEKGDYENAQLVYEAALKRHPDHHKVHSNLGYLKWLKGDIHEAVVHYERAIALEPQYDIAHNNLGVIHLDVLGNVHKAIELIERAIELNENYALAYYNLGRAHLFLGNKLQAARCYQKAQLLNEYTRDLDSEELSARLNNLFNSFDG